MKAFIVNACVYLLHHSTPAEAKKGYPEDEIDITKWYQTNTAELRSYEMLSRELIFPIGSMIIEIIF